MEATDIKDNKILIYRLFYGSKLENANEISYILLKYKVQYKNISRLCSIIHYIYYSNCKERNKKRTVINLKECY